MKSTCLGSDMSFQELGTVGINMCWSPCLGRCSVPGMGARLFWIHDAFTSFTSIVPEPLETFNLRMIAADVCIEE